MKKEITEEKIKALFALVGLPFVSVPNTVFGWEEQFDEGVPLIFAFSNKEELNQWINF